MHVEYVIVLVISRSKYSLQNGGDVVNEEMMYD